MPEGPNLRQQQSITLWLSLICNKMGGEKVHTLCSCTVGWQVERPFGEQSPNPLLPL